MIDNNWIPVYCEKRVLVLGCGNILFGDDGFGPTVIKYMTGKDDLPDHVCFLDVGTSARKILFDVILSSRKPDRIIVVDAMDFGGEPGTVSFLDLDAIPENKTDDFSLHQIPTSNLLRELRDLCEVELVIIVCQPAEIPDEVKPGLSEQAKNAVERAAVVLLKSCTLEPTG
ncbi:MAG: hydrogenase maturation protease [Proteobacteria bacterium]|nr:hydrogenase maturation protease [Pseudomonadota bacterium]